MKIRKPSIAGTFYPEDARELKENLNYLKNFKGSIKATAIMVPHAGHIYSGEVAGEAYKQITNEYEKVIILAPNHTIYTKKAILDTNEYWETPLGQVKIWKPKITNDAFEESEIIHKQEHAIEVQIPFLQTKLKKFELLPIIIGDIGEVDLNKISKELLKLITPNTLIVISTDLSHFLTEKQAKEIDEETIQNILKLKDINPEYACGANPLKVANRIFKELDKKPHFLKYDTSAKITKNTYEVVGYASFIVS